MSTEGKKSFLFKNNLGVYIVGMELLKQRILKDSTVLNNGVLKADSFLNHQVDPKLMQAVGEEFANYFRDKNITKVVTIESSGIAPAVFASLSLDVPMIFARKKKSLTLNEELVTASVYSFTKQESNDISVSRKFITPEDRVLIIDDFLANGQAALGLIDLCQQVGAVVCGVGIVIEKSFQGGRKLVEDKEIDILSLARIASLDNNEVKFVD